MDWKALWEAVKEPLRWFVIALVPIFINWISGQPWNPTAIEISIVGIRIIDKMLHDYGKATDNTVLEGGLTRF